MSRSTNNINKINLGEDLENKKERRDIIEDGKTEKHRLAPETAIEKEASYKHENGNPQIVQSKEAMAKSNEGKPTPIDSPKEEIGSNG
jgi:hypothetical protein